MCGIRLSFTHVWGMGFTHVRLFTPAPTSTQVRQMPYDWALKWAVHFLSSHTYSYLFPPPPRCSTCRMTGRSSGRCASCHLSP